MSDTMKEIKMSRCIRCGKKISAEKGCELITLKMSLRCMDVWTARFPICSDCINFLENIGSTEKILRNIAKILVM